MTLFSEVIQYLQNEKTKCIRSIKTFGTNEKHWKLVELINRKADLAETILAIETLQHFHEAVKKQSTVEG